MNIRFKSMLTVFACGLALAGSPPSDAQEGYRIVRIQDGERERCIDPTSDEVSLILRRAIIKKFRGGLREDAEAAIVFQLGIDAAGTEKQISVPLGFSSPIQEYQEGLVSLPVEQNILRDFRLSQGETVYTGLALDVTVLKKTKKTFLGHALGALVNTARLIPLPDNPASLATGYLFDIANIAIAGDLDGYKGSDKETFARMALNFDSRGRCSGPGLRGFERTGTIAIIGAGGQDGPGHVGLDAINAYCWSAVFIPSFELMVAEARAGIPCSDGSYSAKRVRVTNNYLAFVLNAWEAPVQFTTDVFIMRDIPFGYGDAATYQSDVEIAVARCRKHGLTEDQCP